MMAYADKNFAVNRWYVTSGTRNETANALLNYANMKCNEVNNKEVKEQRKKKNKNLE